jgi:flagellar motor switch protein FliM
MSTRKLNNEEVAALIDGLTDGVLDAGTGVNPDTDYKPFVFGGDDTGLLGDLYTLRLINERLGRQMRNVLLPMLRFSPRIATLPPDTKRFETYLAGLDSFLSLNTARVDALKGTILLTIPPRLVSILVNSFFGGRGDSPVTRATEFTPTEERIIQIVVDGCLRSLEDAWREIFPVSFDFIGSETNPAFTSFIEAQDMVVICSFVVQLPFATPAAIDIIYPLQALKQIAPLLRSKIQGVGDGHDDGWARKLQDSLLDTQLEFSPRIAEPTITLSELMRLKPGMVVDIPAFEEVKVFVEGQSLFRATIGERDGRMAVSITGRSN